LLVVGQAAVLPAAAAVLVVIVLRFKGSYRAKTRLPKLRFP
jgi:hypothetical protein